MLKVFETIENISKEMIGKRYKHFKGNEYEVIKIAVDVETLKPVVIYKDTSDENKVWSRTYEDFISNVDKNKYPNVKQEKRFAEINNDREKH